MKLQKTSRNFLVPCWVLVLSMYAASAYADVVVVVSANSTVTRLTPEQVTNIFLGKTDVFPNGIKAVPIDQAEENPIRNEFYLKVSSKSSSQLSAYWTKIIFTGNGFPPKILNDDVSVKKAVANNPNAIGYIDKNEADKSVRVILVP